MESRTRAFALRAALLFLAALGLPDAARAWTNQYESHELIASDHAPHCRLGTAVAVSGAAILAGSPSCLFESGGAYVFRRVGASYVEDPKLLSPDPLAGDRFGAGVGISGNVAVVARVNPSRQAYAFSFDGSSWTWIQTLPTAGPIESTWEKLVLSGSVLAVPGQLASGWVAHVYRFDGSDFAIEQSIAAPAGAIVSAVAVSGDALLVGLERSAGVETAEVWRWNGSSWMFEAELAAPDGPAERAFAAAVALAPNVALIGAPSDGAGSGSAYVFRQTGAAWGFEQKLEGFSGDQFGTAVALASANSALVGAPEADAPAANDAGAVYHFRFDGSTWTERARLVASNATGYDGEVGKAIAASSSTAVAGDPKTCTAPNENCDASPFEGSVYLFNVKPPGCGLGAELAWILIAIGARRALWTARPPTATPSRWIESARSSPR